MTDTPPKTEAKSWLPDTSRGFWRACLLASLMLNLVVVGTVIGHGFGHNPMDRPGAAHYGMFVPRKFFGDVAHERRRDLASIFRNKQTDFETVRQQSNAQALKLADALTASTYDASAVNALIDGFTTGSESVAAKGADVLKEFIGKLSPEERLLLARDIRERPQN